MNRFWNSDEARIKLKICNIRHIETALLLEELGVDAIGIHIWKEDNLEQKINEYKWLNYGNSLNISKWLLTDIYDFEVLNRIIPKFPVDTLQFQGYQEADVITGLFERITNNIDPSIKLVKSVSAESEDIEAKKTYIKSLIDYCDAILFDTKWMGGTGVKNNPDNCRKLSADINKPVIVAGGITSDNALEFINHVKPFAIDVQSGVENLFTNLAGEKLRVKSLSKIQRLLEVIRNGRFCK